MPCTQYVRNSDEGFRHEKPPPDGYLKKVVLPAALDVGCWEEPSPQPRSPQARRRIGVTKMSTPGRHGNRNSPPGGASSENFQTTASGQIRQPWDYRDSTAATKLDWGVREIAATRHDWVVREMGAGIPQQNHSLIARSSGSRRGGRHDLVPTRSVTTVQSPTR